MKQLNESMIAVITGDVVNSTQHTKSIHERSSAYVTSHSVQNHKSIEWLGQLKAALSTLGSTPNDWQIYRGDSFQLRINAPESAIAVAIWLKAMIRSLGIKGLDLRMAIGIGAADYEAEQVIESNGPAFINSGTLFDQLKKNTLAIKTPWQELDEQLNIFLQLALLSIDRWTANSAKIVAASMQMPDATQSQVAEKLGIPQSRVSEGLDRAGYEPIMQMELYCRELMQNGIVIKKRV